MHLLSFCLECCNRIDLYSEKDLLITLSEPVAEFVTVVLVGHVGLSRSSMTCQENWSNGDWKGHFHGKGYRRTGMLRFAAFSFGGTKAGLGNELKLRVLRGQVLMHSSLHPSAVGYAAVRLLLTHQRAPLRAPRQHPAKLSQHLRSPTPATPEAATAVQGHADKLGL